MEARKAYIWLLFVLLSFSFCGVVPAQTIDELSATVFANKAMNAILNNDFEELFNYFYIPKDYTEEEIQNDKKELVSMFKYLFQEKLGSIEEISDKSAASGKVAYIKLATGTEKTYKQTIVFYGAQYKVNFPNFGKGYIRMEIAKSIYVFKIKSIAIGLPLSNKKTEEMLKDFEEHRMSRESKQKAASQITE